VWDGEWALSVPKFSPAIAITVEAIVAMYLIIDIKPAVGCRVPSDGELQPSWQVYVQKRHTLSIAHGRRAFCHVEEQFFGFGMPDMLHVSWNMAAKVGTSFGMNKDIARLNIEHFRKLLANETNEARRSMIARLLAEEEAILVTSENQTKK
jgi:hypothetical protein